MATRSGKPPHPCKEGVTIYMVTRPNQGSSPDSTGGEGNGHPYGFRKLLEDVKGQIPLETVANDLGAGLKPNGQGLRGLGVDHGGDNPDALMVKPEQGRWWCFRCDEGGDVLDLWMAAKGIADRTDALMDLAGSYGVVPTPRPESFGRKQERQKTVRERIDAERVEHVRALIFRLIWIPWLKRLPAWGREEASERAWRESLPLARMVYAQRRGS